MPNLNETPKIISFANTLFPAQHANDPGARHLTGPELVEEIKRDITINGQRIRAVAPGVLPSGPEEHDAYMEVTAVGTWTYAGSPVGSNASGFKTIFWWDFETETWVQNGDSVQVKGDAGADGVQLDDVTDYLFGIENTIIVQNFTGTVLTDCPLGYYDANGVVQSDATRRRTNRLALPADATKVTPKDFNNTYRFVFFNGLTPLIPTHTTVNDQEISIPSSATHYGFNVNTTGMSVDFEAIEFDFTIGVAEDPKVVTPEKLDHDLHARTEVEDTIEVKFNSYPNFDSFNSGYVEVDGSITPDPTNVRKLSPPINVEGYQEFDSFMSIIGARYRITNESGSLIKHGVLGANIVIPNDATELRFTIKGSSSQANLATDYILLKEVSEIDYILYKSDFDKLKDKSFLDLRLQHSKMTALGSSNIDQWQNFSDGSASVTVVSDGIKLLDNITTVDNQAKIRSLLFDLKDTFSVYMKINFAQLNSSENMDMLDGVINGYGATNDTTDNNINKSGFSFAYIHPTLDVRPIFSICKAIDYDTSGNLEIWRITKPSGFLAGFERVWSGTDIPMNEDFVLETIFEFNPETNSNYYVTIKVDGKILVDRSLMGMISEYGGHNSLLFQCKGTADQPAEFIIKDFKVITVDQPNANLLGSLLSLI